MGHVWEMFVAHGYQVSIVAAPFNYTQKSMRNYPMGEEPFKGLKQKEKKRKEPLLFCVFFGSRFDQFLYVLFYI